MPLWARASQALVTFYIQLHTVIYPVRKHTIHIKNVHSPLTIKTGAQGFTPLDHLNQLYWEHSSHESVEGILRVTCIGRTGGLWASIKIILLHTPCEFVTWRRRQDFCKQLLSFFFSFLFKYKHYCWYVYYKLQHSAARRQDTMGCKLLAPCCDKATIKEENSSEYLTALKRMNCFGKLARKK